MGVDPRTVATFQLTSPSFVSQDFYFVDGQKNWVDSEPFCHKRYMTSLLGFLKINFVVVKIPFELLILCNKF